MIRYKNKIKFKKGRKVKPKDIFAKFLGSEKT